ncbi:MAG: ferredoxin [Chlorobi bacterium]|nr:ferredoxin [Chlorobiota bacterium]
MAVIINDDCISCDACAQECPNTAIYAGGEEWTMADGTNLDDNESHPAISDDFYFVVPNKCTQCVGFNDEPACISVCPVEAIDFDPAHEESQEELAAKKARLHD